MGGSGSYGERLANMRTGMMASEKRAKTRLMICNGICRATGRTGRTCGPCPPSSRTGDGRNKSEERAKKPQQVGSRKICQLTSIEDLAAIEKLELAPALTENRQDGWMTNTEETNLYNELLKDPPLPTLNVSYN